MTVPQPYHPLHLDRSRFMLAMVQMRVDPAQPESNLNRAMARIAQAAAAGAEVVVLPEALNVGWTDTSAIQLADAIPDGKSYQSLRTAAAEYRVHVCAGLIERHQNQLFNSAVLIDPEGKLLLHHRKLNELEIVHDLYSPGRTLRVAETSFGTFGVMICSDAFAQSQAVSRTLAYLGADLILSPCSWAVPADHDNRVEPYGGLWREHYCPVARDYHLWIVGVSNVGWIRTGAWEGRKCIGCSLAIDPDGNAALTGPYGADAEVILYQEIEVQPRPTWGEGWRRFWPPEDVDA
jgi:predicted amidohydrolase